MDVKQLSFESLRRIMRAFDAHSRALLRKYELTGPQLTVLRELARQGQTPIGTLAKTTFLGAPTVTGVVDRLEQQGWVTRVHGKEDRRHVLIAVTPAGQEVLKRAPPLLHDGFCDKLLRMPQARQQQICEALQTVAEMMEQSTLSSE